MRGLLRRLKCNNINFSSCFLHHTSGCGAKWYDEGVYFRHNHSEQFEYFHETFKEHLGETYGVMVYQEDVIKLHCTLQEYPPLMEMFCAARWVVKDALGCVTKVKDNFLHVVPRTSLSTESRNIQTNRIVCGYLLQGALGPYAVESYQSLYLKVHYPVEFMVAVINNQGGFYRQKSMCMRPKCPVVLSTLVSTKVNVKLLYMELTST
jgi:DNA polymerase-3 subunit alpha/error-prone DNA polymerase